MPSFYEIQQREFQIAEQIRQEQIRQEQESSLARSRVHPFLRGFGSR